MRCKEIVGFHPRLPAATVKTTSFLELSGHKREEVIGRTSLELKIWEVAENRGDFIGEVQQGGSVVNIETKFRTKDGSIRLLLSSAEQLALGGQTVSDHRLE